jgi:hypothetical protein
VYKAATQAPAVDLTSIGVGTPRLEVIGRLGAPTIATTNPSGTKEDIFNFVSGLHGAAKARIILYLAADVFTLTLAELVLWPIEMTAMEAASCTAFASYDEAATIRVFKVTKKNGLQGCT